jgi:thiol-disulfide isomerase/thioredoxin
MKSYLTVAMVTVLMSATGMLNGAERPEQALVGKPAPDFKLELLDGGEVELSKLKGKNVVLLDFWATWCGPCRQVMPALQEISEEYRSKGVRYLAVNLREEPAKIQEYLKSAKLKIEVPLDKDGQVAERYNVRGIPTMAIVDKKGIVREVHVGASANLKAELKKTLDAILAGKN